MPAALGNRVLAASRLLLASVLLCLALGGCAAHAPPARAQGVAEGTALDPAPFRPLARWVALRFGMDELPLPAVVASRQMLESTDRRMNLARSGERMRALYTPGIIVLSPETWDPRDPLELSFVVHELVHHAQIMSGRHAPCPEALEEEAYILQNAWLEEQGRPPLYDPHWITDRARCR